MDSMVTAVQQWVKDTYSFDLEVDGITGIATFTALIKALQTEIGVTVDGSFGNATLAACPTLQEVEDTDTAESENLTYILQGSFWCKGYNPVGFTGIFGPNTANAVKSFQSDAGIDEDGIVTPYILQGIMNTDSYAFAETDSLELSYKHNVQIGLNKNYGDQIGLIAPSGEWERKSHRNLIKACQIEWGATVDGTWGSGTMSCAPTLSINTSGYTNSKRLLQWALAVNGFYCDNLVGTFGAETRSAVLSFQELMALDADGIVGKNTWASLLSSCGNTARAVTAFDTSTKLTESIALEIAAAGYEEVGRYLVNAEGSSFDKSMTEFELQNIEDAGLKVFPIFQTDGGEADYFTREQGQEDAYTAKEAAQLIGFPSSTTIYFAVDYDALTADIESYIIPYFTGVNEIMGVSYIVGAYAPRAVCNKLSARGLITYSFVADMSTGFTGNIGVAMPSNWAYDQILETTACTIGIDKCAASDRKTAVSPSEFVSYDNSYDTTIASELQPIMQIYELAVDYLGTKPATVSNIYYVNLLTLQYLRSGNYDGLAWTMITGYRDSDFCEKAVSAYPSIVPEAFKIINPYDNFLIGFNHLAATLNSCLYGTLDILSTDYLERDVDAFAGWAGDLMQMAAVIERSNIMGYNYFGIDNLINFIGSTSEDLEGFHLYEIDEKGNYIEMGSSALNTGFSLDDLYADVDAYNISRLYDLSKVQVYIAINDYYYGAKKYLQRYSIFKEQLLSQFNKDSIYDVTIEFTLEEVPLLSTIFELDFGAFFEDGYGTILAQAFDMKINELIENE